MTTIEQISTELPPPFPFNAQQTELYAIIKQFTNTAGKGRLVITGSAGTGKTSLITYYIISSWYNPKPAEEDVNYILCTPTNKAKDVMHHKYMSYIAQINGGVYMTCPVLEQKLKTNIVFKTISQVLGINMQINSEGVTEFTKGNMAKITNKYLGPEYANTIIIVDESSMIDVNASGKLALIPRPIIFLGDKCQLPPVNEEFSSVFDMTDCIKYNLDIVERSVGNIVLVSNYLRNIILANKPIGPVIKYINSLANDTIVMYYSKPNKWFNAYVSLINTGSKADMGLTWTNKRCNVLNTKIRGLLAMPTKSVELPGLKPNPAELPMLLNNEKLLIRETYYLYHTRCYSSMLIYINNMSHVKNYKPPGLVEWIDNACYSYLITLANGKYIPYKPIDVGYVTPTKKLTIKTLADYGFVKQQDDHGFVKQQDDHGFVAKQDAHGPGPSITTTKPVDTKRETAITEQVQFKLLRATFLATNKYNELFYSAKQGYVNLSKIMAPGTPEVAYLYKKNMIPKITEKGVEQADFSEYHITVTRHIYNIPVQKICCAICEFLAGKLLPFVHGSNPVVQRFIQLTSGIELPCYECQTKCGKTVNILTVEGQAKYNSMSLAVIELLKEAVRHRIKLTDTETTTFKKLIKENEIDNLTPADISLSFILGHYWNHVYKDIFISWDYGYFITVHKSQGSDYNNVFLDYHDLMNNTKSTELGKLIYTGFTRTKVKCHIYHNDNVLPLFGESKPD